jgi:hypothetical protein
MNNPRRRITALFLALLLAAPTAMADGITDVRVEGNTLRAEVSLAGTSATLTLRFENAVGLSAANLGLSVLAVNPLDLGLVARLGPSASVPAAFPLLVVIEPPAAGGLAFSGVVSIELFTHALHYTPGTPLRMYSAPAGGTFRDITTSTGSGSYRSGGTTGNFSEFLIVTDLRTSSAVIDAKFAALSQRLAAHASLMSSGTHAALQQLYTAAYDAWQDGVLVAAIDYMEAFGEQVRQYSGEDIPDVWRSARDLDNVAGELRALAATLRFSLTLASSAL